jgi:hypothetical protein
MNELCSVDEARARIEAGESMLVAGDEALLRALPTGDWIGGTIPYFMAADGGVHTADSVFVTPVAAPASVLSTRFYSAADLPSIAVDGPANGYTVIIVPSGSAAHAAYAQDAPGYPQMFLKPIIGWVSGIALEDLGTVAPLVFDGRTGAASAVDAVVMHVALPDGWLASLSTINLFRQGDGDTITFDTVGFKASACQVNGEPTNLASYLVEHGIDTRLPLVGDFSGALINTSFQAVDAEAGEVSLYAPVFPNVDYRVAAPIGDYAAEFAVAVDKAGIEPAFACNCILNYLYGELEGKRTGDITGPITFGEIAYQLLNQTMAYLVVTAP